MGDVERKINDLRRLMDFKKFDSVQDFSDHYYLRLSSEERHSVSWSEKIQDAWKLLESDLPDGIYVRVSESRMDLLRAVIVGATGTPYHDGLYVFDALFTSSYPSNPPMVHFHAHDCSIHPNLFSSGDICLRLLDTWMGSGERWIPNKSTMLQVLVSLQALVNNAKALSNEDITDEARRCNERAFIESLKLMRCIIKNPPQHFEDLVVGHFRAREFDIMMACYAYSEGADVGCNVKKWFEENVKAPKPGSERFKRMLQSLMISTTQCLADNGSSDYGVQEVSQASTSGSRAMPIDIPQRTTSDSGVQELPQPTTSDNVMQVVSRPLSPVSEVQDESEPTSPVNQLQVGFFSMDL